jgi:hypothetical protein
MVDTRTILEMRDALRQMEGWQIGADLTRLLRTRRVFAGNQAELGRLLSEAEGIPRAFELMAQDNREERDAFLDEVDRLLHNFLAAALTLREHSRETARRLLPSDDRDELAEAYRERIDLVFADSPLAQFIERLRHVATHVRLPALRARAHWSRDEGWSSGVVLPSDYVLARGDWGSLAKQYVDEAGEQLVLLDVVRDYSAQVDEFHDWLREALVERHRGALRELEEHHGELLKLWQEATGESVDTGRA